MCVCFFFLFLLYNIQSLQFSHSNSFIFTTSHFSLYSFSMFLKLYCIFLKQCFIIQLIPNLRNPTSKTSLKVFQSSISYFLLASRLGKNNFLPSSMETVLCWRESIFFTEYHDDWLCWSSSCFQKKEGILEGHFSHNSILTDQSPHGKPAVFEMMQTPTHLAMPWHILWWELITCDAEINYWKRGGGLR